MNYCIEISFYHVDFVYFLKYKFMYKTVILNKLQKKSSKCEIHLHVNYAGDSFLNANSTINKIIF